MASGTHVSIIVVSGLVLYFVWMDVALYYRLQSDPQSLLVVQSYDNEAGKRSNKNVQDFDPFDPISVKLMTLDHLNHYVYYPLTGWLDQVVFQISTKRKFISPDMISYSHILVALIAAKFLYSESVLHRRFGVFLFEIRSFLDSFDGYIARVRNNQRGMVQVSGSWGYYLDGLCDLTGTVFFLIVVLLLMQRKNPAKRIFRIPVKLLQKQNQVESGWLSLPTNKKDSDDYEEVALLESTISSDPVVTITKGHVIVRQCWSIALAMALQQLVSSIFWNRYMQNYHTLLEVPSLDSANASKKISTLQSAPFWIIAWTWRLMNPHAHMSFLLGIIFFDLYPEVFTRIQFLQFVPLAALIITSEVHLQATFYNIPS